jgi:hypothetical protein
MLVPGIDRLLFDMALTVSASGESDDIFQNSPNFVEYRRYLLRNNMYVDADELKSWVFNYLQQERKKKKPKLDSAEYNEAIDKKYGTLGGRPLFNRNISFLKMHGEMDFSVATIPDATHTAARMPATSNDVVKLSHNKPTNIRAEGWLPSNYWFSTNVADFGSVLETFYGNWTCAVNPNAVKPLKKYSHGGNYYYYFCTCHSEKSKRYENSKSTDNNIAIRFSVPFKSKDGKLWLSNVGYKKQSEAETLNHFLCLKNPGQHFNNFALTIDMFNENTKLAGKREKKILSAKMRELKSTKDTIKSY